MTATVRALCVLAALLQACSAGCIRSYGCGQIYPHDVSDLDLDLELDDSDSGLDDFYRVPSHTVQVVHYGDPCTCKKGHSYALEKPYPEPPVPTRTYGYDVQAPPAPVPVPLHNYDYRLEVPVEDPEPKTYTYGYEVNAPPSPRPVRLFNYDYKLELPVPEKQPLLKDLVSEVDRVLLPRKDCNVERRSARVPLGWSPDDSPPGYYLGDDDPEDDDVLHLGGPYAPSQIPSSNDAEVHEQFHDYGSDYKVLSSGGVYREIANDEDDEEEEDASEETLELDGIPAGSVVHSAYYSGNQRGHDFRSDLRGAAATIDGIPRTRYYRAPRGEKTHKYSDVYNAYNDRLIQTPTNASNQEVKVNSGNDLSGEELLGESLVYPRTLNQKSIHHLIPGSYNRITGALYLSSGNIILKAKGESELEEYNREEFNEQYYPENEVKGGSLGAESQYAENDNTYEETGITIREHSTYRGVQSLENGNQNWGTLLMNEPSENNNQFSGYSSNGQSDVTISNAAIDISEPTAHEEEKSREDGVYDIATSLRDIKSNNIEEIGEESFLNSQFADREITGYDDTMTLQEVVAEKIFDGNYRNTDESSHKEMVAGKEISVYENILAYDNSNRIPLEPSDDFGKWKMYWDEYEPSYVANHLSEPPDSSSTQEHLPVKETSKYLPDAPSENISRLDGMQLQYEMKSNHEEGKKYTIHHDFDMLEESNYHDSREQQKVNHAKYEYRTEKKYPSYSHVNGESDTLLKTYEFKPLLIDIDSQNENAFSGQTTDEMSKYYYLFNEDNNNLEHHPPYAGNVLDSRSEPLAE